MDNSIFTQELSHKNSIPKPSPSNQVVDVINSSTFTQELSNGNPIPEPSNSNRAVDVSNSSTFTQELSSKVATFGKPKDDLVANLLDNSVFTQELHHELLKTTISPDQCRRAPFINFQAHPTNPKRGSSLVLDQEDEFTNPPREESQATGSQTQFGWCTVQHHNNNNPIEFLCTHVSIKTADELIIADLFSDIPDDDLVCSNQMNQSNFDLSSDSELMDELCKDNRSAIAMKIED